ncbi:MAG: bile acid:sodium symporter [Spirochaetaceae bacterium]|jgi:ACR3 family arsenite efflux pump ArsB|nr:bile acid:sodium symporter [Spirochaetaceae bacterium]
MSFLSKFQPVFIILSALAGIALGKLIPILQTYAGNCVDFFLICMLFFVFLNVKIKEISKSFSNLRFSISALIINFIFTPLFTFVLSKLFIPGQIDLQIGFIMLMVTPCTDWYLIFTGAAKGNVPLGASILPLNLILQIVLLPVYLRLFMSTHISFELNIIFMSILFVLIIPLAAANALKFAIRKVKRSDISERILKYVDDIQFVLLCLAIISMFASQGILLLDNASLFITLLPMLLLFFAAVFCLSFFTGKALSMPFSSIIPLIFTTSARNSPVSLAIASILFPLQPVISLTLVMGPLIELPVLAINSMLLKWMGTRRGAS